MSGKRNYSGGHFKCLIKYPLLSPGKSCLATFDQVSVAADFIAETVSDESVCRKKKQQHIKVPLILNKISYFDKSKLKALIKTENIIMGENGLFFTPEWRGVAEGAPTMGLILVNVSL